MTETASPSSRGKLVRGAASLLLGHGASQLLGLMRNFLVARMLTPDQFGIASTFVVTIAIIEACSEFGLDKYMVQTKRGDDPRLQRLIHTLFAVRGLVMGAVIYLLAQPIANLFDIPQTVGAFQVLALVPIIRGFWHTDIKRLQRGLAFKSEALTLAMAQVGGLVVAVGLAYLLRDYRAMLWGVIAHALCYVAATHMLAQRRYGFGFDARDFRGAMAFGWPLTLNGLVIVGSYVGDRVVVGANLGMEQLGFYAAVTMLMSAVVGITSAVISGVALPWLSAVQSDRVAFVQRRQTLGAGFVAAMVAIYGPFAVLGSDLVGLIFGAAFHPAPELMAAIVAVAAVRFLRGWDSMSGVALSATKSLLIGNLVRPLGLLLALALVWHGYGLVAVALAIAAGEVSGMIVSVLWLARATGLAAAPVFGTVAPGLVLMLPLLWWVAEAESMLVTRIAVAGLVVILAMLTLLASVEGRRLATVLRQGLVGWIRKRFLR